MPPGPTGMVIAARPRIAALGMVSWDRILVLDRYPDIGTFTTVRRELDGPGGTTANLAVALARLGATVSLAAAVGDDDAGRSVRTALAAEPSIDTAWVRERSGRATDASTVLVAGEPAERTILWHPGAALVLGDALDLTAIFRHDVVVLDVTDHALRRWVTDLPAHVDPRTRLLGTLTHVESTGEMDSVDVTFRHDVVVGSQGEASGLMGEEDLPILVRAIQRRMKGSNLRTFVITLGSRGAQAVTRDAITVHLGFAVESVDPTGAGDAFAAGVAYGLARRLDWPTTLRLANAVGALATRGWGAQGSLPTRDEVITLMGDGGTALGA